MHSFLQRKMSERRTVPVRTSGRRESRDTQAKPKAAPRGGVTASMIVLEPDDLEHGLVVSAAQALDNDQYYAMVDSGTNASITSWHERRDCRVSSTECHSHWSYCSSLQS